jgi:hypothetical protein
MAQESSKSIIQANFYTASIKSMVDFLYLGNYIVRGEPTVDDDYSATEGKILAFLGCC